MAQTDHPATVSSKPMSILPATATLSPETACLYQAIGRGRTDVSNKVKLQLRTSRPGKIQVDGLIRISLLLEGQTVFAWLDESAWMDWITPLLPAPDLASIAPELHLAAAIWTLTTWFDWCTCRQLPPPIVKAVDAAESLPVQSLPVPPFCLSLSQCEDVTAHGGNTLHDKVQDNTAYRHLDIYLDGFSPLWLTDMANAMPQPAPPQVKTITVPAIAGFVRLTLAKMTALKVGDTVMMSWEVPLDNGELLLALGVQMAQIRLIEENIFKVECMMQTPFDNDKGGSEHEQAPYRAELSTDGLTDADTDADNADEVVSAVDTLPVTLSFEIGQMTVPVSTLAALEVGKMLEAEFTATADIGIRAHGRLIAIAKLVRIGDRLGAQITRMASHDTAQPDMT